MTALDRPHRIVALMIKVGAEHDTNCGLIGRHFLHSRKLQNGFGSCIILCNCSLQVKNYTWRQHWGLRSDLHVWSNQIVGSHVRNSHQLQVPYPSSAWTHKTVCGYRMQTWSRYFFRKLSFRANPKMKYGVAFSELRMLNVYSVTEFRAGGTLFATFFLKVSSTKLNGSFG